MYSDHQIIKLFRVLTKAVIFLLERWVASEASNPKREDLQEAILLKSELEDLI